MNKYHFGIFLMILAVVGFFADLFFAYFFGNDITTETIIGNSIGAAIVFLLGLVLYWKSRKQNLM